MLFYFINASVMTILLLCNGLMNDQSINFKFPLRVLNWNVKGLGDAQKCYVIKDLAIEANPDLLTYQETKWSECSFFRIRQVCQLKFKHYTVLDTDGTK